MDAKIYRRKKLDDNVLFEIIEDSRWHGDVQMNKYALLTELKYVDKQEDYKENYNEVQGPLDCLFSTVPLQVTDIVVLTNSTWDGTYFCRTFGWLVLDGDKFDIGSKDFISSIARRGIL